ncbi:hypothetical protein [Fretibacter rubidus]|uniref:hypothetical protein n=1 Tax=Fretibacter rubidus TaxID=570162 RepID=UPI00352B7518
MNEDTGLEPSETRQRLTLPPDAAEHYIADMLNELCDIAEQAELKDLAALLRVTVTAVETNRRLR